MASETSNIVTYDGTYYNLKDKEDVIELFNDLINTVEYLRSEVKSLQYRTDYIATHYNHSSYNSEEE